MDREQEPAYGNVSMIRLTVLSLAGKLMRLVDADSSIRTATSSSICLPDGRSITVTLALKIESPDTAKPSE